MPTTPIKPAQGNANVSARPERMPSSRTPRIGAPMPRIGAVSKMDQLLQEVGQFLGEFPPTRLVMEGGRAFDDLYRGALGPNGDDNFGLDPEDTKVAGVPFGPGSAFTDAGIVYHGTPKSFKRLNPAYNDPNDLFGRMTHFAKDKGYASDFANADGPPWGYMPQGEITNLAYTTAASDPTKHKELWKLLTKYESGGVDTVENGWIIDDIGNYLYDAGKIPDGPSRVIPAKLDVKNALNTYSWPPTRETLQDMGKLGANIGFGGLGGAVHDSIIQKLGQNMTPHATAKQWLRTPIDRMLKQDPARLERTGFDGILYSDGVGASHGYEPAVWAINNPAKALDPVTGKSLGVNIKPENLQRAQGIHQISPAYNISEALIKRLFKSWSADSNKSMPFYDEAERKAARIQAVLRALGDK